MSCTFMSSLKFRTDMIVKHEECVLGYGAINNALY